MVGRKLRGAFGAVALGLLFALCVASSVRVAEGDPPKNGYWCESLAGECFREKSECRDESCHWRLNVWRTNDWNGKWRSFQTGPMCERHRERVERARGPGQTTPCRRTKGGGE